MVLKESILTMIGKTYVSVTALIYVMFISRIFSTVEYGTYRQVMLIANTINLILLLGVNETISYHYKILDKDRRDEMISNMIGFKLLVILPVIVLLYLLRSHIAGFMNNEQLESHMLVIMLITFAFVMGSMTENYYLSAGKAALLSKMQIALYTLHYIVAILIVTIFKSEFIVIIEIGVFELIKTIIFYMMIFRFEKFSLKINWRYMYELIRFTIPIGLSLIIITINQNVDQLMISMVYGPEDYAIYNNGAMNIPIVQLLTISVSAVVFPKLSFEVKNKSFKEGLIIWKNASTNTALVLISFMWLFFFFAEGYVEFIFSARYLASVPIMRIYLMRMLIVFTIYSSLLVVLNKKKVIAYIAFGGLLGNIVLNLIFIQLLGMKGPALSTVMIQFIVNISEIMFVMYYGKVKLTEILEFTKLIKIIVMSGGIAFVIRWLASLFGFANVVNFFVFGTVYILVTYVVFFLTGQIDKEILTMVKKKLSFTKGA